ncbi:MAG: spore coat associated protein CotJA [Lachnospiraceae bacterium]|nr:spore coat associated protein CotJA [Lachnospiraceae bacterium]
MNCNQNSGCPPRRPNMMPGPAPCPCQGMGPRPNQPDQGPRPMQTQSNLYMRPMQNPGYQTQGTACMGTNMAAGIDQFPVGMGYIPWHNWETPFPMDHGFRRGTIFPSLDYPFVMGRCRK